MLKWYEDEQISVFFDNIPHVVERFIVPYMDENKKKKIKKYPYGNLRNLKVIIFDHKNKKIYKFTIAKGYCSDGASIPGILAKILIGAKTDNKFLIAAIIHDWMCEHHDSVGYNRNLSSKVFRGLLLVGGTPKWKAQVMYLAVDTYQRTQGWEKQEEQDDKNGNEVR